jgi:excisionase family DNA binding protein
MPLANAPAKSLPPKKLYTVDEASQATAIGRTKLYEYMKDGRLRYCKAGDRRLIKSQDLDAFIETLAVA